ncbi:MAG: UvrD-helicase domain-containing protein [Bacteroidales bacterium]
MQNNRINKILQNKAYICDHFTLINMSFTVYKSSAGSGKTFTLVKEYLKIALNDLGQFPKILAITFTNKAASEMQERILNNLQLISYYNRPKESQTPCVQFLLPELEKETGLSKDQLASRAEKLLGLILHNFSDFAIGTIDSFTHKIIRTFAQDLNIAINFQVELESDKLLTQSIDLLLDQVGHDQELTNLLIDFTRSKISEEKSWHIEYELSTFAQTLLKEDSFNYMEKLRDMSIRDMIHIRKRLFKEIREFDILFQEVAKELIQQFENKGIQATDFYQGKRGVYSFIKQLAQKKLMDVKPNAYAYASVCEEKWFASKASQSAKETISDFKEQICKIYYELETFKEKHWNTYVLKNEAYKRIYALSVLSEIEKIMHKIKQQQNILHISEFNKKIANIIFNEPVPFIYERLGERYKNFLIDEFQDTSILQWRNLIPLIENSLAEGEFNMVVGDGKQAIYRWRNGEVSQFRDLPKIYQNDGSENMVLREKTFVRNYKEKILEKNFRSKAELVDFNNRFFNFCRKYLGENTAKIYDNQEQLFDTKNKGGYIEFYFSKEEKPENDHYLKVLKYINNLQKENYDYRDIAILCRKNSDANNLASFLIEQKIPILSEESLLIASNSSIQLIVSILKVLTSVRSQIYANECIVNCYQHLKKEDKISNQLLAYDKFIRVQDNAEPSTFFIERILNEENLKVDFKILEQLSLYEICEEIIQIFQLNKNPDAYIITFLDEVQNFCESKNNSVKQFLDHYEERKKNISVNIPDGINAVRIMSIHKSKGLEFPIIICPFAWQSEKLELKEQWFDWSCEDADLPVARIQLSEKLSETSFSEQYKEEKDKSRLDLINLMYVAFTRAKKQLYILSKEKSLSKLSIQNLLINFLNEEKIFTNDGQTFAIGKKEITNTKQNKTNLEQIELKKLISKKGSISFARTSPFSWNSNSRIEAIQRGDLLHAILEQIHYSDELETILEKAVFIEEIKKEQYNEFKILFENLFKHPQAKKWFSRDVEVFNEQEIIVPSLKNAESSRPELHRPDRIVKSKGETIVIDYKSGQKLMTHISQILRYKHLLQDMGEKKVKGYLIYLGEKIIVDGPH